MVVRAAALDLDLPLHLPPRDVAQLALGIDLQGNGLLGWPVFCLVHYRPLPLSHLPEQPEVCQAPEFAEYSAAATACRDQEPQNMHEQCMQRETHHAWEQRSRGGQQGVTDIFLGYLHGK